MLGTVHKDPADSFACGVIKLKCRWCFGHSPSESYRCEKPESEIK